MNPFIRVKDLTYCYEDNDNASAQPTLKNLDLEINEGEFVAVLGHNGSGKSTFAKLLNMILVPSSGEIYIDGKNVGNPDMSDSDILELRKNVGMVFQNPDNQLVATIVEDDVAFGPENLGIPSEEIRARVNEVLSDVGMLEYATHEPHRLSGGQKQRIAIAGVLAMLPKCIIFDESTAMLDPIGRKEVMDAILRLNREKGITVLTITHYMNEAAKADRVIVLDDGRILMEGTPAEVFARPDLLHKAGLDVPQCSALVEGLRAAGYDISGDCYSPELCAEAICRYIEEKRS